MRQISHGSDRIGAVLMCVACIVSSLGAAQSAVPVRDAQSLNGEWTRTVTRSAAVPAADSPWTPVQVPSLARGTAAGGSRYAWYRRPAAIPAKWKGKRIFLRLWGARYAPRVFVDGKLTGARLGGWTPFEVEITNAVKPGTTIRLDVCCQDWSATFKPGFRLPADAAGDLRRSPLLRSKIVAPIGGHWGYFGIWDDVELRARPRTFLDDVAIAPSVRRKELTVTGRVRGKGNGLRVSADVVDGDRVVLRFPAQPVSGDGRWRLRASFPTARYWSPEDPHLYQLVLHLETPNQTKLDVRNVRFGFRELWAQGPDFFLNGVKRHLLAGSTWPDTRYQSVNEIRANIRRIKAANCIAFRLHTQPWQHQWLDVADEEGLMLVEEGALWCDGAGGYDYSDPVLWKNIRDHEAGMVRRDRNHASLVMWSIENEILHCGAARYAPDVEANLAAVGRFVKALDPTHLVTFEADLDPKGVADVIGLHYPHELPQYTDYPNTANWIDQTVTTGTGGGLLGSRRKNFQWKRNKPLYIGEYLWAPSGRFAPGTAFFGEAAYLDRAGMNRAAKALAWTYQTQAYRRADVSGMCPWTFADRGGASNPEDILYQAVKEAFTPTAAFPVDVDWRFFGEERIVRRFDLFNDGPRPRRLELHGAVGGQNAAAGPFTLEPGGHVTAALTFTLPRVSRKTELPYRVELLADGKPVHRPALHAVAVYPRRAVRLPTGAHVVIYAPKQKWQPGLAAERITDLAALARLDVRREILVIAPNALEPPAAPSDGATPVVGAPRPGPRELRNFLVRGGRMLVLEQRTLAGLPVDVRLVNHPSTFVFPLATDPNLLCGLAAEDFKFWRGDNYVSRREIRRPSTQGARTILVSGGANELDQGPLVEVRAGPGRVLLCQALVGTKLDREPAARILFENCLAYLARQPVPRDAPPTPVLSSAEEFTDLLGRLGVRHIDLDPKTKPVFPSTATLLILHGGGNWERLLQAFLKSEPPGVHRTVYWQAPAPAAFARLKRLLGAEALAIQPASGPVSRDSDDSPLFRSVSREELYFVGNSSGRDWRKPISPAPDIIDSAVGPAEAKPGDAVRIAAADMKIQGKIVRVDRKAGKVLFATNGSAAARVPVAQAGLYRVTVRASGTPFEKTYPLVRISVNGRAAAEVLLRDGDERAYPVLVRLPAGSVELTAAFVNDASGPGEDRNLTLDSIAVDKTPFALPGARFLTRPPAVVVLDVPAAPGRAAYRLVLDTIRWDRPGKNRRRADRYASALLANLGAEFAPPPPEADWVPPSAIEPVGKLPYFKKTDSEVSIVAAGSVQADFLCKTARPYSVLLRARSKPADGAYAIARVLIDGKPVGECEVHSEVSDVFRVGVAALTVGRHRVAVEYTNDLYDPAKGWDRNLYLNGIGFGLVPGP